jgi:hypothetical protein
VKVEAVETLSTIVDNSENQEIVESANKAIEEIK